MQSIPVDTVTSYTGSICQYCNAIFGSFRDFISHIRTHMDIVKNTNDEDWSNELLQTMQEEGDTSNSSAKGLLVMVSKTKELTRWVVLPCQKQCMSASTSISNIQDSTNNIKPAKTEIPLQDISTFVSEERFNSSDHIHTSRETIVSRIKNQQFKPSVKSRKRKIINSDNPVSAPKHLCVDNDLSQILDKLDTETHHENVLNLYTSQPNLHQSISDRPFFQSYFCQHSLSTPVQVSTTYTQANKAKDLGVVTASKSRNNPQVSSRSSSAVCLPVDMTNASNNLSNMNPNAQEEITKYFARILPSKQSIFWEPSKVWENQRNNKHHYKHRKNMKKHKCRCTDALKLCKKHLYIMPKITNSKAPEGMSNHPILPSNQSTLNESSKAGNDQINKKHHHKYRTTTKKHKCRCADPLKLCKKHNYIMPKILADFKSGTTSADSTSILKTGVQPFQKTSLSANLGHYNDTTNLVKRASPKMYISHSKKHASVTKPEIQEENKMSLKIKKQSEIHQSKTTCERGNCWAPKKEKAFLGQRSGLPLDKEQINTYLEKLQTYLDNLRKLNTQDRTKYQQVSSEADNISEKDWIKCSGAVKSNRQHNHPQNLAGVTGPNTETYGDHVLETKKQSQLSTLKAANQKKILQQSQQKVSLSSKIYNKTKSTMGKHTNIKKVGNQLLKKKRKPQPIVIKLLETERQLQPILKTMTQDMMLQTYRKIQPKADMSSGSLDKIKQAKRIETHSPTAGNQVLGTEGEPQPSHCSMTNKHATVTQTHFKKQQKDVVSSNTYDKTKNPKGKIPHTKNVGNQTSKTKRKLQTIVINVQSSTSLNKPKKAKRIEAHTLIASSQISGTEKQPQSGQTILANEQNSILQTHVKWQHKIALSSKSLDKCKADRGTEINTKKAGILSLETEKPLQPRHTNKIKKQEEILQVHFKRKQKASVSSRALDENKQARIVEKQSLKAGNQTMRTEGNPQPSHSSMNEEQENTLQACDSTKVLDELTQQKHTNTPCTAENQITAKTMTENKNMLQDVSYENNKIFTNNLNSACHSFDRKIKAMELDKLMQPTQTLNMSSDHAGNISSLDHTWKLCKKQYDHAAGLPAHMEEYHKNDIVNFNANQQAKGQTAGAQVESNKNKSRPQLRRLLPRKALNDLLVLKPNTVPLQKVIPTVVCNTLASNIPHLIPISWPSTNLIDNITLPQLQKTNELKNATTLADNVKSQSNTQHSICTDSTPLVQSMTCTEQLRSCTSEMNGCDSAQLQKDILSVVSKTNLATTMPHRNPLTMEYHLSPKLVNINQQSSTLFPVTTRTDPPPLQHDVQSAAPTTSLGMCMPQLISKNQSNSLITNKSDLPPLHPAPQSAGTKTHFVTPMLQQKSKSFSSMENCQLSQKLQEMKPQTRSHMSATNKSDEAKVFKEQLQRVKDIEKDAHEQLRTTSSLLLPKCTDADKLHNRVHTTSEMVPQWRNLSFQQQQEKNAHDKKLPQLTPAPLKYFNVEKIQTEEASLSEILLSPFSTQQKTNPNPPVQQIVNPPVALPHRVPVSDILATQPKTSSEILQQMQHTMSQKNIPLSVKSKLANYLMEQISQIHKEEQEITLRERNAQYRCKYCTKHFPSFHSVRYHEAIHSTENYLEKINSFCNFTS